MHYQIKNALAGTALQGSGACYGKGTKELAYLMALRMPFPTLRMQLLAPKNNQTPFFTSHDVCSLRSYPQRG